MPGESTLEKFRQRLERGMNEYRGKGGELHAAVAGALANLGTLCEGMALTARRVLRQEECHVDREVMPYNLDTDSFVVRHRFFRKDAQTNIDVTFSTGHVAYGGHRHPLAEIGAVEDAIADAVLSFYLPR